MLRDFNTVMENISKICEIIIERYCLKCNYYKLEKYLSVNIFAIYLELFNLGKIIQNENNNSFIEIKNPYVFIMV